ncbi:hypothetical protein QBC44DRAFT_241627 [Cladorrhinum sp. PSN332]|nr:hypothetical protein QBC44DRAFT_241627 [Cladorrhinum sp. PSN332]
MADIETNTGVADTDTGSKTVIGSFILDPDGDLTIRAGEDLGTPRDFKVCSSAVRRASPIFKERILGSWLESKPKDHDKIWLVTLGGDEPDGLQILLQLIHASRLAEIPTPISIENLNSVVALVKAYDLFHVVQPWARSWMDAAAKEAASSSSIKTIVLINWIAWEMGNRYLFDATANTLASQVSCDANNGLRDTNGDRLEEESFVVHVPSKLRPSWIKPIRGLYGDP